MAGHILVQSERIQRVDPQPHMGKVNLQDSDQVANTQARAGQEERQEGRNQPRVEHGS